MFLMILDEFDAHATGLSNASKNIENEPKIPKKPRGGHFIRRHTLLEPAPQGMGAPQATESTQQNGVEALRSFPGRSRPLLEVHLMSATRAKIEICPE